MCAGRGQGRGRVGIREEQEFIKKMKGIKRTEGDRERARATVNPIKVNNDNLL